MTEQIEDFKSLRSHILSAVGARKANYLLKKSIFLISSGGNDLFAFFKQKPAANKVEIEQFMAAMISNYKSHFEVTYPTSFFQIKHLNLYDLRASRLLLFYIVGIVQSWS